MVGISLAGHRIQCNNVLTILLRKTDVFCCRCSLCVAVCVVMMLNGAACCPGNSLPDDINCLAADRMLVFAAAGTVISAFAKNKEVHFAHDLT